MSDRLNNGGGGGGGTVSKSGGGGGGVAAGPRSQSGQSAARGGTSRGVASGPRSQAGRNTSGSGNGRSAGSRVNGERQAAPRSSSSKQNGFHAGANLGSGSSGFAETTQSSSRFSDEAAASTSAKGSVGKEQPGRSTRFTDEAVAAVDRHAAKEQHKADAAVGNNTTKTNADRDRLLEAYNTMRDQKNKYNSNPEWGVEWTAEDQKAFDEVKDQLKDVNAKLGNDWYSGMDETAEKFEEGASSWRKERNAGILDSVGSLLTSIGMKGTGEKNQEAMAELDAIFGTGNYQKQEQIDPMSNAFGREGQRLIDNATGQREEAGKLWEDVTGDMSDTGKAIANIAKTGADVAADLVDNVIVPGSGTFRMYLGAAGSGAREQMEREDNDPDSVLAKAVTSGASAYLSTLLTGGMEQVYGKSILGEAMKGQIAQRVSNPAARQALGALLNTEGVEEGLEDILGYASDRILGLEAEGKLDWNQVKQDAFVGYVLGVLTNGLMGGIEYDGAKRQALADEALEFVESGKTADEAIKEAKQTSKQDVVMRPAAAPAAEANPAPAQPGTAAPQNVNAEAQNNASNPQSINTPEAAPTAVNEGLTEPQQSAGPAPATAPQAGGKEYTGERLPGAQYGGESTVKVGKTKVPVHFAVVPASQLSASHDIYGDTNPNYPAELQPRDRTRGTSQAQSLNIGTNLDPGEVEWSNNATTGAPIIRPDGVVVSGNGRTLGIEYAMQTGRSAEYTQYLRDNAARFGLDPNSITEDSILVRVADGDYDWQSMAEQSNVSDVSRMSTTEQARVDAERLARYPEIMDLLVPNDEGNLNTADNADFINEFLHAVVPESEQGSVWTAQNGLSQEGKRRIENAIFQMAYGDASMMARLSESLDNNMKNVSNSLLAAAGKIAALENDVANGSRYIGARDMILNGVKLFEAAKQQGVSIEQIASQVQAGQNAGADAVFLAEFLEGNSRSAKQIRTFLNAMADTANSFGDPNQVGFFDTGKTDYTSQDVLEGAIRSYEQETGRELGRPDYDFYGTGDSFFDIVTDREGQSRNTAQPDTAADRPAAGTGENTGSGTAGAAPSAGNTTASTANAEPAPVTQQQTQENTAGANPNPNTQIPVQEPGSRREKLSRYFSNTLVKSRRAEAEGLSESEFTYLPKSEVESLTNAMIRLNNDYQGTVDLLMNSPAWSGEMTDAAYLIQGELYKEFIRTGDATALTAWEKLQKAKIGETARGLQAVAKQSRPDAASVLSAANDVFEDLRAKAEQASKTAKNGKKAESKNTVTEEQISEAEQTVRDTARRMGEIEVEIDDKVNSGMSREEAENSVKEQYLDLADKINTIRNTGFFRDASQHADMRKGKIDKMNTSFREALANQDMEFIKRFVACQAVGIAEDVQYEGKQDRLKQLNTFQKLAQLTGTGTWGRNIQGNTTFSLIDMLASNNPLSLLTDRFIAGKTGQKTVSFEKLNGKALSDARRAAQRSMLEIAANIDLAEDANSKYDMSRTRTYDPGSQNTFTRFLSRWEQLNGYALQSSDAFFKGLSESTVRDAAIRANGWDANNLTKEQQTQLDELAKQVAEYRTFQNDSRAAKLADALRDELLNKLGNKNWEQGQFGIGTALMPYTKVPSNIGVKALEFSPFGAAKGFYEVMKARSDPNTTLAKQNQAVTDFSRGITGTALIVGLAAAMKGASWFKNWDDEDNKDVAAQNKAEGKSGIQINLSMLGRMLNGDKSGTWQNGDRTIDISSIEPANQILTAASLLSEDEKITADGVLGATLQSAMDSLRNLPSVSAISNIEQNIRYTDTPDDLKQTGWNTAASAAGSVASGFIPAPIRHAASVTDPYARDTRGDSKAGTAVNQILASLPGGRQMLPVKTDNFGNEITSGDLGTRMANTYLANRYTQVNQSDVSRQLETIRNETGEVIMPSRNAPKSETFGGEKVKLTADQGRQIKQEIGQTFQNGMQEYMDNPFFTPDDYKMQGEVASELLSYSRAQAKANIAEETGNEFTNRYEDIAKMDNPLLYVTGNKTFNLTEEAGKEGNWDAVDALIGEIGKASESDQAAWREKNSTAMNYFDYLNPNQGGFQVGGSQTVYDFKSDSKAAAEQRGVKSASGLDKLAALQDGVKQGKYSDDDVDAFMSKTQSDGDLDMAKYRNAAYFAMRQNGFSSAEALQFANILNPNAAEGNGYVTKAEMKAALDTLPEDVRRQVQSDYYDIYNKAMLPTKDGLVENPEEPEGTQGKKKSGGGGRRRGGGGRRRGGSGGGKLSFNWDNWWQGRKRKKKKVRTASGEIVEVDEDQIPEGAEIIEEAS